jgi:hypothetical protein
MTTDPRRGRPGDPLLRLGALGLPFLGLVAIEFLLGISLNLFVSLPTGSPPAILESSPVLDVHVAFGLFLLGIATNALLLAAAAKRPRAILVTSLGLVAGVGAFGAGVAFAFGDPSAVASYVMSLGFVGLLFEAGYLLSLRPLGSALQSARSSSLGGA